MHAPRQKSPWIKDIKIKAINIVDKEFLGTTPPTVFVGSKLWPKANVGVLSPIDDKAEAHKYDDYYYWHQQGYPIQKIVELRSNLINARSERHILDVRTSNKFLQLAQEIAMTQKPVTIDVELKKKLKANIQLDQIHLPFGPVGDIHKIQATENITIKPMIERVFNDTDLKAVDALHYLHDKGVTEHALSQLLSIGTLGIKHNRKLVPTRWSITATHDMLGKDLIKEIKHHLVIDMYRLYFGNYFGNHYLIFLFPNVWGYELFESSMPDKLTNKDQKLYTATDSETYSGRKGYADNTVGGYYCARLSLLEHLHKHKIQASALLLRFVTSEYSMPLGVWVTGSATTTALQSQEYTFANRKDMLAFARTLVLQRFGYNIDNLLTQSKLLHTVQQQQTLAQFS